MSRALALIARRRAAVCEELALQRRTLRDSLRWPLAARALGACCMPARGRTRVVAAVVIGVGLLGLLGLLGLGRLAAVARRPAGRGGATPGR